MENEASVELMVGQAPPYACIKPCPSNPVAHPDGEVSMTSNPVRLEFEPVSSLGAVPDGSFALSAGDGFEGDVYAHFHGVESLEFEEESLAELEQAAANLRPGQVLAIRHR